MYVISLVGRGVSAVCSAFKREILVDRLGDTENEQLIQLTVANTGIAPIVYPLKIAISESPRIFLRARSASGLELDWREIQRNPRQSHRLHLPIPIS